MNDKLNDKELVEAIKNQQKNSGILDKETFWNEFKERKEKLNQDTEVEEPVLFVPVYAKVAACFVFAACIFSFLFIFNIKDAEPEVSAVIQDYKIYTDYSAVLIIEDEDESGTILWVTGLDENNTGDLL